MTLMRWVIIIVYLALSFRGVTYRGLINKPWKIRWCQCYVCVFVRILFNKLIIEISFMYLCYLLCPIDSHLLIVSQNTHLLHSYPRWERGTNRIWRTIIIFGDDEEVSLIKNSLVILSFRYTIMFYASLFRFNRIERRLFIYEID